MLSVIDSRHAGKDAGDVLDGKAKDIPIFASIDEAMTAARKTGAPPTHFVVGLAPDGGRLENQDREAVKTALAAGLHVDCGLHDFLSEDSEFQSIALQHNVAIRDIRKPPSVNQLHFFSGKIEDVSSLKIAVLGTDSAVGKRTTAWMIVQGFQEVGVSAEMIGTGQTAWLQGAAYSIVMDALVNDFVSGEIEHAVWRAWHDLHPDVLVIEGQGSLMNPAYPGGFEILAAGRPDLIVLQHAPARVEYDGFPGYPIQPLARQIELIELLCGKPVAAVTINHENLKDDQIPSICEAIQMAMGIPAVDVLRSGPHGLVQILESYVKKNRHQ
jgi:uncharacterized NAD-dependent epimerase/dehydratase family protein